MTPEEVLEEMAKAMRLAYGLGPRHREELTQDEEEEIDKTLSYLSCGHMKILSGLDRGRKRCLICEGEDK